jgi:hypothetical protein
VTGAGLPCGRGLVPRDDLIDRERARGGDIHSLRETAALSRVYQEHRYGRQVQPFDRGARHVGDDGRGRQARCGHADEIQRARIEVSVHGRRRAARERTRAERHESFRQPALQRGRRGRDLSRGAAHLRQHAHLHRFDLRLGEHVARQQRCRRRNEPVRVRTHAAFAQRGSECAGRRNDERGAGTPAPCFGQGALEIEREPLRIALRGLDDEHLGLRAEDGITDRRNSRHVHATSRPARAQHRERRLPSRHPRRDANGDPRPFQPLGQVRHLGGGDAEHLAGGARYRRGLSARTGLADNAHGHGAKPGHQQEGVYLAFGVPPQSGEGVVQGRDPAGI